MSQGKWDVRRRLSAAWHKLSLSIINKHLNTFPPHKIGKM